MLLVEKVRRVSRIQSHGLKAIPWPKCRASPLPDPTHIGLSSQSVTPACYGHRMPMLKSDVGGAEVDKMVLPLFSLTNHGRER